MDKEFPEEEKKEAAIADADIKKRKAIQAKLDTRIKKAIEKRGCRDGKSRVYDEDGALISVNGVDVSKKEEKKVASPSKTGNQPTLKGGK